MIDVQLQKQLGSDAGGIDLDIRFQSAVGECIAIYGASGAGKTSLLRLLAGLLTPDHGYIHYRHQHWVNTTKNRFLSPQARQIGFLFQDYALFPNMTVRQNLAFAQGHKPSASWLNELVHMMDISDLMPRKPLTLSGGQQQRVALARALVQRPQVLLLDEPLAALDNRIRGKIQDYLLAIQRQYQLTIFFVSHDISEIYKLANQVLVLEQGKILTQGSPTRVFQNHELSGKFQFIGEIVALSSQDFIWIVSVLIGQDIVRVIADEHEAKSFTVGDRVIVASKAFNPVIRKISSHD